MRTQTSGLKKKDARAAKGTGGSGGADDTSVTNDEKCVTGGRGGGASDESVTDGRAAGRAACGDASAKSNGKEGGGGIGEKALGATMEEYNSINNGFCKFCRCGTNG